jgi:hypothetical protein
MQLDGNAADRKVPLCSSGCRREILLRLMLVPSSPCIRDAVLSSWIIGRPVAIVIEWGFIVIYIQYLQAHKWQHNWAEAKRTQVGHLMRPSFPIDSIPNKRPSNLVRVKNYGMIMVSSPTQLFVMYT